MLRSNHTFLIDLIAADIEAIQEATAQLVALPSSRDEHSDPDTLADPDDEDEAGAVDEGT